MRIDAHQHYWRHAPADFPWIEPATMAPLARDRLPAEVRPLMDAACVDAAIAVQARPLASETGALLGWAADHRWIAGVVGWADLAAPDVGDSIARWRARGPLVGLRAMVQDAPDPAALLADAGFNRGVAAVQAQELTYDVLITARHLGDALAFCARHDRHWLVLDHLGKPDIRNRTPSAFDEWERGLHELAALPHVACKLSGLVTEAVWDDWSTDELLRYGRVALDAFGSDRVLFGSDWPVCTLAASYDEVVGIAEAVLGGASASERADVFGDTAARCYGIAASA